MATGETEPLLTEDIFFQPSTRGGREVYLVLEGKVGFRNRAEGSAAALVEAAGAFGEMALLTDDTRFSEIGVSRIPALVPTPGISRSMWPPKRQALRPGQGR